MDRRNFLSAAAAAAVMAPAAALALPVPAMMTIGHDRAAWDAAMLAFERATANEAWFDEHVYIPARDRAHSEGREINGPIAEHMDLAVDKASDARWALLALPAPDAKALRWKLEYLLADDGSGGNSSWEGSWLKQTMADIARLLV